MKNVRCSIEDFWNHVMVDEPEQSDTCWVYYGGVSRHNGYLYGRYCGEAAHRIAFAIYTGQTLGSLRRSCKNGLCVRKEHFTRATFPHERPKYDIFTGELVNPALDPASPIFQEIVDLRRKGYNLNHSLLSRKTGLSASQLKYLYQRSTLYVIIEQRAQYLRELKPIPSFPTMTLKEYYDLHPAER